MILPIVAYGDPVLKKKAAEISNDYPDLEALIGNMFETMYKASGVGLAAPQIGKAIRLFVVDASPFADKDEPDYDLLKNFKKVFINARITEKSGDLWAFEEGCLSIPEIREDVNRCETIQLEYLDEHFNPHSELFSGLAARVIQHEYDHIEGVLFIDHLSAFKRQLLRGRLNQISRGLVRTEYRMRFPEMSKKR